MSGIKIRGTGRFAPAKIVTNDDLAKIVDTNDEWITTRTGIKTRHHCTTETHTDMCVNAARQALENAVYSILSPEGFASILWKDSGKSAEACELMKLTATDLLALGVIDDIIPEPEGGTHLSPAAHMRQVDRYLSRHLSELAKESGASLAAGRYQKFRRMGTASQKEEA